jgi:uncharacterized protein
MYEVRDGQDVREPIMQKLQDEGLLRERELELLENRKIAEVDLDDIDEASQRTMELMKRGEQTIYKGVLTFHNWVGRPDVLERVEGKSNFGSWYYVACDIKRSRHLKDEYRLQGAFYAEILEKIQGIRPIQGYVLHTNGEIEGYLINEVLTNFHLTLDSIERILEGEKPPVFLTSDCKQSPYFSECRAMAMECDDLSLINRLWRSEADALKQAGIPDLSTLALASKEQLNAVSGIAHDRLVFLSKQAEALKENKIIKLHNIDLPENTEIELVIDIESDPLRDIDYMFGVLKVEGESQTYHSFFAKDHTEVEKMWLEFVAFLEKYPTANIYHYGWYETDVFRKFIERFGASNEVEQRLTYSTIDLLPILRESIIFPLPFYSLKDIAKYLGFKWRSADASGLDSVLWFHDYCKNNDKESIHKIMDYNEDDVSATWFLIDWARKQ